MPSYASALIDYIKAELLQDASIDILEDQDLLMSGLLDSISVVRLASHIETEHKISIPPEDMVLEHFGSVSQIDSYIQSRTTG